MAELHERGERPDILFWVGCMGSFDDRAKKTTVAFARILQAAGIRFAILGQEESCNGDPARRMGNEYLYQTLAQQAIGTLDRYEVTTIVTSCPHCFHQIGNEFPQLGGNYEVIHHSTYIERLLADERVPLRDDEGEKLVVAYHDSCYLGRYNDVYDAPREALKRALPVVTAGRGAALARPRAVLRRRRRADVDGGERGASASTSSASRSCWPPAPTAIAVACPFCMTMLSDAGAKLESTVPVYDIAEVVASRLAET